MHDKTLAELAAGLKQGEFSSEELTRHFVDRIEARDDRYNAFITPTPERALEQARAADRRIAEGNAGLLTGLPLAHKDIFCTRGVKTSCGSKMLDNFVSPYDATVVEKLAEAGMVTLGKTNMDEFAMGSSNETSYYGPVKNPWDESKVPGGSSGGSAAAVAARLAPAATGTDTGGSIRQPAALTGLTGFKPTYGRVSRYGMIAFASSLDQAGTLTISAEDAALMTQAMAGFDERDSTSAQESVPDYLAALGQDIKGLKIGVPPEFFDEGLDADTRKAVDDALDVYRQLGAEIREVHLPHLDLSVPTYYVVAPAECSSNLSRFDGVRFGYRCENPKDLLDLYERSRGEGFGAEVKRRVMTGTYVLSAGYYDAYYLQAQKTRKLIRDDFLKAFEEVDVLMGPTTPTPAFGIGEKTDDPITMYLNDIYTIAVNLAGLPAVSVPAGLVGGLPVGLQIIGNFFDEGRLLNVAHQFQQQTDWHRRLPEGIE
ncbi:Asp-tRNA(Asn)/Glu-tRNA(Gln) amidotransferase subunit GatA [Gammaproteobacteria bacterium AB-CW1]|uniref:Glutamyl-tRNA(Gln) amidotransferase subunit A n=1 Tax=Natronospira elongata TaxID=3110268 RepID=A0AAP6JEE0_9GAMM|nr:Asp-tRNA(Asn)/Glu-tRNA(Gln) amidotransferase subunit GatA [Gammaproteobacteria bacterium AB-CW1]